MNMTEPTKTKKSTAVTPVENGNNAVVAFDQIDKGWQDIFKQLGINPAEVEIENLAMPMTKWNEEMISTPSNKKPVVGYFSGIHFMYSFKKVNKDKPDGFETIEVHAPVLVDPMTSMKFAVSPSSVIMQKLKGAKEGALVMIMYLGKEDPNDDKSRGKFLIDVVKAKAGVSKTKTDAFID